MPPTLEVFFYYCTIFIRNCTIVIRNHMKSSSSDLKKKLYGLFSMFQACVSISSCIFYVFMNIYIYTGYKMYVCINGHTPGLKKKNYRPTYMYCIRHYFRVQLFSRFWPGVVIREWLISRFWSIFNVSSMCFYFFLYFLCFYEYIYTQGTKCMCV